MNKFNEIKLKQALDSFQDYSKSPRYSSDTKERRGREVYFKDLFSRKIDEYVFSEIVKKLWASRIWGNKDYLISKIIRDNGIDLIRTEFEALISSSGTSGERYERFIKKIKGMGPSMVTEILCYSDPENAGIWNSVARDSLGWLEVEGVVFDTYKISGEEYDQFNQAIKDLAKILNDRGFADTNLLQVDYFLWETADSIVWKVGMKSKKEKKIESQSASELEKRSSRHDELRDKIAQIGAWLGFDVETEKSIATGARVDVEWRTKIGNLGSVSYVFEVQDKGSIDSLIVNLQKAQKNRSVQKLIIASDSEQIIKIQKEIVDLPEIFRNSTAFWDSDNIDDTHRNLEQVANSIDSLKLMEG